MSFADSTEPTRRHRRSLKGQVHAIECNRRAVGAMGPVSRSYAAYVGRVGALAVALGVGSAVASVPVAFADTTGSAGSAGSSSADAAGSGSGASESTKAPSRVPARAGHGASSSGAASGGAVSGDATSGNDSPAPAVSGSRGRGAGPAASAGRARDHRLGAVVVPGVAGVSAGSVEVPSREPVVAPVGGSDSTPEVSDSVAVPEVVVSPSVV